MVALFRNKSSLRHSTSRNSAKDAEAELLGEEIDPGGDMAAVAGGVDVGGCGGGGGESEAAGGPGGPGGPNDPPEGPPDGCLAAAAPGGGMDGFVTPALILFGTADTTAGASSCTPESSCQFDRMSFTHCNSFKYQLSVLSDTLSPVRRASAIEHCIRIVLDSMMQLSATL